MVIFNKLIFLMNKNFSLKINNNNIKYKLIKMKNNLFKSSQIML